MSNKLTTNLIEMNFNNNPRTMLKITKMLFNKDFVEKIDVGVLKLNFLFVHIRLK